MRRFVLGALATLLSSGGVIFIHKHLRAEREHFPASVDLLYLPPPDRLVPMAIGYREALADLIWIRAVVFAGTKSGSRNLDWIRRYVDTVAHLAPRFRQPYAWGGTVSVYSGGKIDRKALDQAVALLRDGVAQFPEDHELLFALGMILYRDLSTIPGYNGDEIESGKREGISLIRKAAAFGAPPLVRQLAATLESESGSDELQIQFLEQQLLQAKDQGLRRLLQKRLSELIGETRLRAMQARKAQFEQAHQQALPYTPSDHFAVLELNDDASPD